MSGSTGVTIQKTITAVGKTDQATIPQAAQRRHGHLVRKRSPTGIAMVGTADINASRPHSEILGTAALVAALNARALAWPARTSSTKTPTQHTTIPVPHCQRVTGSAARASTTPLNSRMRASGKSPTPMSPIITNWQRPAASVAQRNPDASKTSEVLMILSASGCSGETW